MVFLQSPAARHVSVYDGFEEGRESCEELCRKKRKINSFVGMDVKVISVTQS